ncbi:uncharacterized protein [Venturia canescens]|uniref:uncharacterized protein n=1 Tax=Venturia canescens TaxID=32260 RepID=UPI001C9C1C4D|nr:uncharacterized protein LOC122419227 [Venturia canescens]
MSELHSRLAMLFLPIIVVCEISVVSEETKIRVHGRFYSATAKLATNGATDEEYSSRNSTDILPSVVSQESQEILATAHNSILSKLRREIDLRKVGFGDGRRIRIERRVTSSKVINPLKKLSTQRVDDFGNGTGLEKLTKRKRREKESPFALSKQAFDGGYKLAGNHCEEPSAIDNGVDYVYPESQNFNSTRRVCLGRSIIKKRNKQNFDLKNDDDEITGVYYPNANNNEENSHRVRELIDQYQKELPMEIETKDSNETNKDLKNLTQDSITRLSLDYHEPDQFNITDIPWPIVPGPITCDLDYQLQPSFVARLGEFDYVVSMQRQENPDEPAEHTCTGVIYNRRFVIIALHCVSDNYGLTVTSTDDLCTIDEMISVDYIIEHKNYDSDTRIHDIALLKLKSEIHKKSAKFPDDDEALETHYYAVGFGELMWNSFPTKVSKLLQKVPVRPAQDLPEAPGTLHVTTSFMDLTGTFRGDYGGALVNPKGEFIGLKSKLIKKSTEYEVYTKVRDYLPWIKSMVALHGS